MKLQTYTHNTGVFLKEGPIVDINLEHITSIIPVVCVNYVVKENHIQKKSFFGKVTTYPIRGYVRSDDVHLFKWTMKNGVDFLVKEDYDLNSKSFNKGFGGL